MQRNLRHATIAAIAVLLCARVVAAGAAEFPVEQRSIPDVKAVFATVESVRTSAARARIGGTIGALSIREGDRVELGQQLAVVTDPKLPLQLAALDAQIESLRAQRAFAEVDLARVQKLRASGATAQSRLDEAQTTLDVVKANIAAKLAERAVVAEQSAEGAVLAPAAGRVLRVQAVNGAVVEPGETIASIAIETYVLRMRLPERHAKSLHVGDKVMVGARGLEAAPERLAEGVVRLVYPELDQGRVVADVNVAGLGDFFVGERTRVFVATGTRRAILVPAAFLLKRSGVTFALVKGIGEVVVQPGQVNAEGVEILSGLAAGDILQEPEPTP